MDIQVRLQGNSAGRIEAAAVCVEAQEGWECR